MYTVAERLATLEEQMSKVEEGVANFRDFQADARNFFARSEERDAERARVLTRQQEAVRSDLAVKEAKDSRRNRWIMTMLAIITVLLGFWGAFMTWKVYTITQAEKPKFPLSSQNLPQSATSP